MNDMEAQMYLVEDELVEAFRRDGFVKTPGVLDRSDVERFGRAVDREVYARTRNDGRSVADKTLYEQSFVQCMRLWETSLDVRPLSLSHKLASIASQLLGESEVLLWTASGVGGMAFSACFWLAHEIVGFGP